MILITMNCHNKIRNPEVRESNLYALNEQNKAPINSKPVSSTDVSQVQHKVIFRKKLNHL